MKLSFEWRNQVVLFAVRSGLSVITGRSVGEVVTIMPIFLRFTKLPTEVGSQLLANVNPNSTNALVKKLPTPNRL